MCWPACRFVSLLRAVGSRLVWGGMNITIVYECENVGSMQHATSNWRERDKRYLMNNDHFIWPSFCSGKNIFFDFVAVVVVAVVTIHFRPFGRMVRSYGRGEKEKCFMWEWKSARTNNDCSCVYFVKVKFPTFSFCAVVRFSQTFFVVLIHSSLSAQLITATIYNDKE